MKPSFEPNGRFFPALYLFSDASHSFLATQRDSELLAQRKKMLRLSLAMVLVPFAEFAALLLFVFTFTKLAPNH